MTTTNANPTVLIHHVSASGRSAVAGIGPSTTLPSPDPEEAQMVCEVTEDLRLAGLLPPGSQSGRQVQQCFDQALRDKHPLAEAYVKAAHNPAPKTTLTLQRFKNLTFRHIELQTTNLYDDKDLTLTIAVALDSPLPTDTPYPAWWSGDTITVLFPAEKKQQIQAELQRIRPCPLPQTPTESLIHFAFQDKVTKKPRTGSPLAAQAAAIPARVEDTTPLTQTLLRLYAGDGASPQQHLDRIRGV